MILVHRAVAGSGKTVLLKRLIEEAALRNIPSIVIDGANDLAGLFATTLFVWLKKHPRPAGRPLRGLRVIDEAKDIIPSRRSTLCKESLMRLAAQARKYCLGVVFATQNPREIENTVIGNCSTHFYGKVSSPAAIETIQDLIRQRGGSGHDVGKRTGRVLRVQRGC